MAVPRKLVAVPNAATRELWRIAENGEIDELDGVLPQADINARNEHGMTALMRAAYHGRVQMVRTLLEHGADPNITRKDQFTAVSLAAFFGHAEIVDLLMRHGANTDAATRFGTSPHMWATARTYGDVARALEKRREDNRPFASPEPKPRLKEPTPVQSVAEEFVSPSPLPEVRTLKEPPEIWDLVHEAPRNFNARSAFMARISSTKAGFVLPLAALLIVVSAGIGAAWFFKDRLTFNWMHRTPASAAIPSSTVPAPVSTTTAAAPANSQGSNQANNSAHDQASSVAPEPSSTIPETPPTVVPDVASVDANRNVVVRRSRSLAKSRAIDTEVVDQSQPVQAPVPPAITAPKPESQATTDGGTKKTAPPANTQLLSPPKNTAPKGKVIQWP